MKCSGDANGKVMLIQNEEEQRQTLVAIANRQSSWSYNHTHVVAVTKIVDFDDIYLDWDHDDEKR